MNRILISLLLMSIIYLSSCKNEPHIDIEKEKSYQILALTFETGLTQKEYSDKLYTWEYSNNTSVTQKFYILSDSLEEQSIFKPDNKLNIIDDVLLELPIGIDQNGVLYGDKKWRYSESLFLIKLKSTFKDSLFIKPFSKIKFSYHCIHKEINLRYKLKLKEVNTNEVIYSDGLWTGRYPYKLSVINQDSSI